MILIDFARRRAALEREPLEFHDVEDPLVVVQLPAAADGRLADDDALLVHERVRRIVAGEGLCDLRDLAHLLFLGLLLAIAAALEDVALGPGRILRPGDDLDAHLVAAVAGVAGERPVDRRLGADGHRRAGLARVLPHFLGHALRTRVAADLLPVRTAALAARVPGACRVSCRPAMDMAPAVNTMSPVTSSLCSRISITGGLRAGRASSGMKSPARRGTTEQAQGITNGPERD